jgi:predicted RNA-binding Zn-ribbon protein involved in translation (DUF1610 family)
MTKQILADPKELVFIQSRAETNYDLVDEYTTMMRDGVQFDAAQGVRDEVGQIFVHDGLHRGEAAKLAGIRLLVKVQPGTRQDAEWLALSANQKHGLRRSHKDKQRIVRNALLHPYGASLSDREIARHCGVDHKTVGKVRADLETTGEIPQLDKRIVKKASGETYEIDTTNIGGTTSTYAPVWKVETAIRQWLDETFEELAEQLQVLTDIKNITPEGQHQLTRLLSTDILPSSRRKRDVIQACHNVLDQLRPKSQSPCPNSATLESTTGTWAYEAREAKPNGQIDTQSPAVPQVEHKPQPQEFECPRCGQEKIVGVNGSRRWCLNCGAEWPTAAEFMAEVNAARDQAGAGPTRTELQQRFLNILTNLAEQPEQLVQVEIWLTELERQLGLAVNLHLTGQAVAPILSRYSIPILEYA